MKPRSNLERVLKEGHFAVTVEIGPPKGADPSSITSKAAVVKGCADAYNVTDNQTAVVRLSSLGGCKLLLDQGLEPIMQMTCRDRNRIALQSDILGASSLGIRNMLMLTGDHQLYGNHPQSKGVYDIDSLQLLQIAKHMRDQGIFQNGEDIKKGKPVLFLGAAANPFADPLDYRVERLEKKIKAGADFIQTQSVFNLERFAQWLDDLRSRGLDTKIYILAGITPLKSVRMMQRMKYHVPGVDVPDEIEKRMMNATDPQEEGYCIALDTLKEIQQLKGLHGVHITALFWESILPRLIKEAGLHPRV